MVNFLSHDMNGASMFCVLFGALCYMVNGDIFLPTNTLTSVADTVGLECHEIVFRSDVDLAVLCVRRDSCMAVATAANNGMICSCPDGSPWPEVTDFTLHLRTRTYVTLPGRYFAWIEVNLLDPRKNGRHFADDQAYSNVFSWMRMSELRLRFHWSLSLRVLLIKFQHWFR